MSIVTSRHMALTNGGPLVRPKDQWTRPMAIATEMTNHNTAFSEMVYSHLDAGSATEFWVIVRARSARCMAGPWTVPQKCLSSLDTQSASKNKSSPDFRLVKRGPSRYAVQLFIRQAYFHVSTSYFHGIHIRHIVATLALIRQLDAPHQPANYESGLSIQSNSPGKNLWRCDLHLPNTQRSAR